MGRGAGGGVGEEISGDNGRFEGGIEERGWGGGIDVLPDLGGRAVCGGASVSKNFFREKFIMGVYDMVLNGRITDMYPSFQRFEAMKNLFYVTLEAIKATSPEFLVRECGEDEELSAVVRECVNKHVGLSVAQARLLGVATTQLKEMGDLYRKELEKNDIFKSRMDAMLKATTKEEVELALKAAEEELASVIQRN